MDETKPVAAAEPVRYRSYLVRLWREQDGGSWRCQVRCVLTGQERRFAGLECLFEFLRDDAADEPDHRQEKGATPFSRRQDEAIGHDLPRAEGST